MDHGIVSVTVRTAHYTFFGKSQPAQKRPNGLVRMLGNASYPVAANLAERIPEQTAQDPVCTPARRYRRTGNLDIGLAIPVVDDARDQSLIDNAYRRTGSEILDIELSANPLRHIPIMADQQRNQSARPGSSNRSVRIHVVLTEAFVARLIPTAEP